MREMNKKETFQLNQENIHCLSLRVIRVRLEQARASKSNKKKKRFFFSLVILTILLAAFVFALISNYNKDNAIYEVGYQATDFKLHQINKNNEVETLQLSDLKGKGVMLNFWA